MPDVQPKKCFIAMPVSTSAEHSAKYNDDEHWKHVLEEVLVPAVESAGFVAVRPTAQGTSVIHARIIAELSECQMVVCDLSVLNPNVLFELGVRTSLNLPIALVAEAGTKLPFDVGSLNTHFYDPSLSSWKIREEIGRLAAHITESEAACAGDNPLWRHFGYQKRAEAPDAIGITSTDAKLELLMEEVKTLRAISELDAMQVRFDFDDYDHSLAARHRSGGSAPMDLYIKAISRFDSRRPDGVIFGYVKDTSESGAVYVSDEITLDDRASLDNLASRYEVKVHLLVIPRLSLIPATVLKNLSLMPRGYRELGEEA